MVPEPFKNVLRDAFGTARLKTLINQRHQPVLE
jgi:hypothetical protein